MLCSLMQVLVVALCSSVLVVHVGAAPQMNELTQALQEDFMSEKDLTDLLLLRFMSELMASGGEELHHELEEDEFGGGRERLTRRHIRFAHRARKAGCRNFFWKSFTSC
ncbi:somatostatin-1A [Fundulus heteroclitus]|uniref:somatostatin-1A n=1 Tax=Fundulus heteroclitus TaxID=8078 RepID=UPI00165A43DD|nr:somatostatin-1A [Fundulus heteroclitus]